MVWFFRFPCCRALLVLLAAQAGWSLVAYGRAADVAVDVVADPGRPSVTQHDLVLADGRRLAFTTDVALQPLRGADGAVRANIFRVAYTVEPLQEGGTRPLAFVLNGGPGAASVFLHLGGLGPWVVGFDADGGVSPPPERLQPNPHTWLAFTDLVFVDPVGTGYSRAVGGAASGDDGDGNGQDRDADATAFWGVRQDVEALGAFMRDYLMGAGRWMSPIHVVGESYGGFRVAALARHLLTDEGLRLAGGVLVSPVIDFQLIHPRPIALSAWVVLFPSLAAAAEAHGRSPRMDEFGTLAAGLAAAEAFAVDRLLPGLAAGDRLPRARRRALLEDVAGFTGLPASVVRRRRGRIDRYTFAKELLREQERVLGLYDASFVSEDAAPDVPWFANDDPTLDAIKGPFTAGINHLLRTRLAFHSDRSYEVLNERVFTQWDWSTGVDGRFGFAGAGDDLKAALSLNPALRLWIVHGLYDLVTPYFASTYAVAQMHLASSLRDNLRFSTYHGGHMFYTHEASRTAFATEARSFFDEPIFE